ncbi:MAG: hypothetical protein BM556_17315 [Bacteriovorax sp. MedPE-SWde]|nr:MAG: hypothetical protein BM556_17315 [Bacteriovorax sp. MedPE-SWde]
MTTHKDLFLKLELPDIETKLRELLFSKKSLKIWQDADTFISQKIHDVDGYSLKLDQPDFANDEDIYFASFCLRGMSYYLRGTFDLEEGCLFKPMGDIYRAERRQDVRYLMYPRFESYIYFSLNFTEENDEENENVVSINRFQDAEKKIFKSFNKELRKTPELGGEKILDLSSGGLSFVCSESELLFIKNSKETTSVIIIDGKSIELNGIEIVYDVDYLNARIESVPMKKVGASFEDCEKLNVLLDEFNDNSIVLTSLDEDFQKFIDTLK